jgi:hypothetical protein
MNLRLAALYNPLILGWPIVALHCVDFIHVLRPSYKLQECVLLSLLRRIRIIVRHHTSTLDRPTPDRLEIVQQFLWKGVLPHVP